MTSILIYLTTRRRSVTILLLVVITIALMANAGGSTAVPIAANKENQLERQ